MSPSLLVVQIAVGLGLLGLVGWLSWRARVHWAGTASMFLAAVLLVGWCLDHGVSEGDSLCLRCGHARTTVRLLGIPVLLTSRDCDGLSAGDTFTRAFPAATPPGHAHDWERIGCTRSGLGRHRVSCRNIGHPAWFLDLTALADRESAARAAAQFAALPRGGRLELLTNYPQWVRSASGEQRFADWRAYWIRQHPDWR